MINLFFMIACGGKAQKFADDARQNSVDTQEDTARQIIEDCVPNDAAFPGLEVSTTDIPTVPQVQWNGEPSEVLYTDAMGTQRHLHSTSTNGNTHVVFPLGLRPNAVYTGQLVRRDGDHVVTCSSVFEMTTQALPAGFPEVDIRLNQSADDGLIFTSVMGLDSSFVTAFDAAGEVVWVLERSNSIPEGEDFPIKVVAYDPYRNRLVFNRWQNSDFCEIDGYIVWLGWGGLQQERWAVPGLRVGMSLIGDGTMAVLRCEMNTDGFEEDVLSIATNDSIEDIWRATDTFPNVTDSPIDLSWVHANFLHAVSPSTLLMSMERIQSVGSFDLENKAFDWLLSGKTTGGDYESSESLVHRPHSIVPHEEGYLIYNRGSTEVNFDECAHVRYVELDDENQTATSPWKIDFDPCGPLGFFGDVFTSENHIVVIWSDRGQLSVYNLDRSLDLQLNLPLGHAFTFGGYVAWSTLMAPHLTD